MNREEKIAKARELRAARHSAPQIAELLEVSESTVRNWYLGGTCVCGALLDGSSGAKSSTRCRDCVSAEQSAKTRAWIVDSIRLWFSRYGELPGAMDWNPALARQNGAPATAKIVAERYEAGDWPAASVVTYHFGNWNAAIRAAGFTPRRVGQHRPQRVAA